MDERSNWTASLSLENLTLEQVDELIVKIVEIVEGMGGFVGGGFMPEEEEGEHGKVSPDARPRASWSDMPKSTAGTSIARPAAMP